MSLVGGGKRLAAEEEGGATCLQNLFGHPFELLPGPGVLGQRDHTVSELGNSQPAQPAPYGDPGRGGFSWDAVDKDDPAHPAPAMCNHGYKPCRCPGGVSRNVVTGPPFRPTVRFAVPGEPPSLIRTRPCVTRRHPPAHRFGPLHGPDRPGLDRAPARRQRCEHGSRGRDAFRRGRRRSTPRPPMPAWSSSGRSPPWGFTARDAAAGTRRPANLPRSSCSSRWVAALDGIEGCSSASRSSTGSACRAVISSRQSPRDNGQTRGTFALRSAVRPNPIATSIVILDHIDGPNLVRPRPRLPRPHATARPQARPHAVRPTRTPRRQATSRLDEPAGWR